MATPTNKYVAYKDDYTGDTDIGIIETELCGIAQMDAWHDHKTISGLGSQNILELVNGYTALRCVKPTGDEDTFMFEKLIVGGSSSPNVKYCRVQTTTELQDDSLLQRLIVDGLYEFKNPDQAIFNDVVSSRYKVLYCDTKAGTGYSLIQAALNSQGITEDYFLIKDTAKSDYSADLLKTGVSSDTLPLSNPNQLATSLLTGPGIYDPGPTTTPFTGTGVEQGFTSPDSKSKFGIIDFGDPNESVVHYPEWTVGPYTKYDPVERLIYSKYDCKMVATTEGPVTDPQKYITQTNSTFYIKETIAGKSNVFYVNKTNSDKATDLAELAFSEKLEKIGSHRFPPRTQFPFPEASNIVTSGGIKKIYSKKVGDSGQALYTLRDCIHYKEYAGNELIDKRTNGIHGFVSFDRVAIVSSLFYGAPIVIFITDNGFVIYISKQLINTLSTPQSKFERMRNEVTDKIQKIDALNTLWKTLIGELTTKIDECERYKNELYQFLQGITTQFVANISGISSEVRTRDNVKAKKYDKEYKLWLSKLYLYNQLSSALGKYYKNHSVTITQSELDTAINGKVAINSDLNDENSKYTQLSTLLAAAVPTSSDQMEPLFSKINTDISQLTDTITLFNRLQSRFDELALISDIYNTSYTFGSILALQATDADEKQLNGFLKSYNQQIADSISSITFTQGLQNPGCLMSLFTCFGSNKLPYIGPIYEICRYYQDFPETDTIIRSIIEAYNTFIRTIQSTCKEHLFYAQIHYLYDRVQEGTSDEMLQLSDYTKGLLNTCYLPFLNISGGKTRKYKGNHRKRTIKHRKIIKGGSLYVLKAHLEFNSTISLLQLYQTIVDPDFAQFLSLGTIDDATKSLIRSNVFVELLSRISLDNAKYTQNGLTKDQLMTIFTPLYEKTKDYVFPDMRETTDFKIITNNIIGEHNFILFKILIIFVEIIDIIMSTGEDQQYYLSVRIPILINTLTTLQTTFLPMINAIISQQAAYNEFMKAFTLSPKDIDDNIFEFQIMVRFIQQIDIIPGPLDINEVLISYSNMVEQTFTDFEVERERVAAEELERERRVVPFPVPPSWQIIPYSNRPPPPPELPKKRNSQQYREPPGKRVKVKVGGRNYLRKTTKKNTHKLLRKKKEKHINKNKYYISYESTADYSNHYRFGTR